MVEIPEGTPHEIQCETPSNIRRDLLGEISGETPILTLGKSIEILEKTSREISEATPTKFLRSNSKKTLDNPLRCPQRNCGRNP